MERRRASQEWGAWYRNGRPAPPPPAAKQVIVADHAKRFRCDYLVETGTYRGDMVDAQKRRFRRIFTIELDDRLYERAVARFRSDRHVVVLHGDSGRLLPEVIRRLEGPALFWLDGHYSGGVTARGDSDTPVVQELAAILADPGSQLADPGSQHVVLIDDARCFGSGDYPSIDEIVRQVQVARPGWDVHVEDDIIRIHAPATSSTGP